MWRDFTNSMEMKLPSAPESMKAWTWETLPGAPREMVMVGREGLVDVLVWLTPTLFRGEPFLLTSTPQHGVHPHHSRGRDPRPSCASSPGLRDARAPAAWAGKATEFSSKWRLHMVRKPRQSPESPEKHSGRCRATMEECGAGTATTADTLVETGAGATTGIAEAEAGAAAPVAILRLWSWTAIADICCPRLWSKEPCCVAMASMPSCSVASVAVFLAVCSWCVCGASGRGLSAGFIVVLLFYHEGERRNPGAEVNAELVYFYTGIGKGVVRQSRIRHRKGKNRG